MKKHCITLILSLLCSILSAQQLDSTAVNAPPLKRIGTNGQETEQQPSTDAHKQYGRSKWFTVGAKVGYNISLSQDKISDLYSIHTGMRNGGSAGFYLRLGTNVFCQPEVLYTFAIYDESRNISGDTMSRAMQTHTIDVPVLLGYSPICSQTFKFRVLIGPRFIFNVNTREQYNNVPLNKEGITVSMNKGRLGLDCGVGFDFWKISLDLRYVLSIDIFKYQYYENETGAWKNVHFPISTFNVSIGYNLFGNNMPSGRKQTYDPTAYDFFRKNK